MKNILIIYFSITFLFLSRNTNRKILSNCSEYKILDSIAYVDFPDIYIQHKEVIMFLIKSFPIKMI